MSQLSLVWPKPNPNANVRLFCVPYAGGCPQVYHQWPDTLPSSIEVCSISLPGRRKRFAEPPFTRMKPAVQAILADLMPYLDKPFAIFGHSMGALIAYELASTLQRSRLATPGHLFVSGCYSAKMPNPRPLHTLPDADFKEAICLLDGMPTEVLNNAEIMDLITPTLRADFTLAETYCDTNGAKLNCPVTAFGGSDDPMTSPDEIELWRHTTNSSFSLHILPGNHFFLHQEQSQLCSLLTTELNQTLGAYWGTVAATR
jgi:medium-chain acyl-[acyl-carrier-protein] hydrolase